MPTQDWYIKSMSHRSVLPRNARIAAASTLALSLLGLGMTSPAFATADSNSGATPPADVTITEIPTTGLLNLENGETQAGQTPDPHPATVQLLIGPDANGRASLCSGAWVGANVVLTAAHCFRDIPQGQVRVYTKDSRVQGVQPIATGVTWEAAPQGDAAVIVTTPAAHATVTVEGKTPTPGSTLQICGQNYVIQESDTIEGNSQIVGGKGNFCANVTALDAGTARYFQIPSNVLGTVPMFVEHGDSGGPVYNQAGNLVGVISAKSNARFSHSGEQLLFNASVPVSTIADWLVSKGVPVLGASGLNLPVKELPPNLMRVSGVNRLETSRMLVQASGGVESLIITTGLVAADGLAATQLAGVTSAATALSNSRDKLDPQAVESLNSYGLKRVIRVGGTVGLSAADRKLIKSKGLELVELIGSDRFDTAVKVAKYRDSLGGTPQKVLVADGINFPDALAAGAAAANLKASLVLTGGAKLPAATRAYLQPLQQSAQIITVGGPAQRAAVGAGINPSATYTGASRYETALSLADALDFPSGVNGIVMASGRNFPDALSAGAYTVKQGAKLVLVPPAGYKPALLRPVWEDSGSHGVIVGGIGAVPDQDVAWAIQP